MEKSENTSKKGSKYEPCDGCDKAPIDCEGVELCVFLEEEAKKNIASSEAKAASK